MNLKSKRLAASLEAVMIDKTNFACRLQVVWDPGGVWVPVVGSTSLLRVKDQFEDLNQHLSTCRACNVW